jgi:hypothetical protein
MKVFAHAAVKSSQPAGKLRLVQFLSVTFAVTLLQLALWWCLFENASASVRSGDIFSGFIYLISGSNSTVGFIQGINGCMQARL